MIRMLRLFAVFALLCTFVNVAAAQATADLHITVKDKNGAVVRNATVTVRNEATNFQRVQTLNVEGEYPFRALAPGAYNVEATAPGFGKVLAKDVVVTVGQIAELPVSLNVASVAEVVDVASSAELIETQRSSSATTIEQKRIENLPINGRNYINFALTNSQLARDTAPSIGAAPTSGLNVGGQRARSNQVNVDGMDAVDNSVNGIRSTVSQEGVQEFQLLTSGYAAEYGRASGGIVNIITKGGGNDIHGSAFAYLRNRNIQATNPFSTIQDPAYTRVQTGFALGGPIKKNKTFYYFSFETTRRHESGYSSIGQNNFGLTSSIDMGPYVQFLTGKPIPAGAMMAAVTPQQAAALGQIPFSALVASGNPAMLAQAGQVAQYAVVAGVGGTVALTGVNPLTAALGIGPKFFAQTVSPTQFDALPAAFVPLNSLKGNFPIFEGTSIYSLRLDHKLTNNQQLLLRGSASPSTANGIQVQAQGPQNFGQNAWSRTSEQQFRDASITAQHSWIIGASKINEFRYQFSRRGLLYSYSREAPGGSSVGVNIPGIAFFGREPFSYVNRTEKRNQFTDNFTWTKGSHTIKFGADFNYLPVVADFTVNFGGVYNFGDIQVSSAMPTLSPVQAYGAGIPQNFIQGVGNPHLEFANKTLGAFVQDQWRISRTLTLNYGVRYDVEWSPTFAEPTALAQAAADKLGITKGIPRDFNNVAPRVGLAWDMFGDGKSVMRASYGMFYDHPLLALAFNSAVTDGSQAPQVVLFGGLPSGCSLNAANTFTGRYANCALAGPLSYTGSQQRFDPTPNAASAWRNQAFLTAGPGGSPLGIPMLPFGFPTGKDFQYSYSNQVNFTLEHDFGHDLVANLQYNFNGGHHLNRPINANPVRTDLLVQNWQIAMNDPSLTAAQKASFANDPRSVTTPTGLPMAQYTAGGKTYTYVIPATVSFFRPSGVNIGLIPYNTTASPANPYFLLRNYLNALGMPDMGPIPFSDMPANYSNGSSVYHGLTANLRKRFSKKYEFLASYTWSHAIDDSTDLQSPLSPQDNYHPERDRSTSLFDQRHRFIFSAVYTSGKTFAGNGFLSKLLSDWTVAPIIEVASGRPYNIITGIDANYDFGSGSDRPLIISSQRTDACGQTAVNSPYGWLIPACFKEGNFTGNAARNIGRKPVNVFNDLRIARRINLSERFKMDGIVDIFNVANKFNVADVNPLWTNAGKPTAAFDPRQFQFALRLNF